MATTKSESGIVEGLGFGSNSVFVANVCENGSVGDSSKWMKLIN